MIELNFAVALLCILGGGLVLRAFAPHIAWRNPGAADYLALSMGIALIAHLTRTAHWDIYWVLSGNTPSGPGINILMNSAIVFSEYLALRARLLTIPAKDRKARNFITAAWYPRRVKILLRRRRTRGE